MGSIVLVQPEGIKGGELIVKTHFLEQEQVAQNRTFTRESMGEPDSKTLDTISTEKDGLQKVIDLEMRARA